MTAPICPVRVKRQTQRRTEDAIVVAQTQERLGVHAGTPFGAVCLALLDAVDTLNAHADTTDRDMEGKVFTDHPAKPKRCDTCVFRSPVTRRCQSIMSQWKHYVMSDDGHCEQWAVCAPPTAYCEPKIAPTTKPTCGQCDYWLRYDIRKDGVPSNQSRKCATSGNEPACPAFVAERSEKS